MTRRKLEKKTSLDNIDTSEPGNSPFDFLTQAAGSLEQGGNDNDAAAKWIETDLIEPWAQQPRRYFDEAKIDALAKTFSDDGFKGVLNVRPLGDGRYQLVAGERRWRAARQAGLERVRCIVDEFSDEEALQFGLIENLKREDLSKLEETQGLIDLMAMQLEMSAKQVIKLIGSEGHTDARNRAVPNEKITVISQILESFDVDLQTFRVKWMRTLTLPEDLKKAHLENKLSYQTVLQLGRLDKKGERETLVARVINENLSLREVTAEVRNILGKKKQPEDDLVKRLNTLNKLVKAQKIPKQDTRRQRAEELLAELEVLLKPEEIKNEED